MSTGSPTTLVQDTRFKEQDEQSNNALDETSRSAKSDSGVYVDHDHKNMLEQEPADAFSRSTIPLTSSRPQSSSYFSTSGVSGEAIITESPLPNDDDDVGVPLYDGVEELSDHKQEREEGSPSFRQYSKKKSQNSTSSSSSPSSPSSPISPQSPVRIITQPVPHAPPEPSIRRHPSVLVTPPQSPIRHEFNGSPEHTPSISALLEQSITPSEDTELQVEVSNPSHLFWVPASQHPEIAPNEFANWLFKHNHGLQQKGGEGLGSVRRRKSVLSVSYGPDDIDKDVNEEEDDSDNKKIKKRVSMGEGATKNLLQTLQEQEAETEDNGDRRNLPAPRMSALRRSVSLSANYKTGPSNDPEATVFDRNSSPDIDSPVIVARSGLAPGLRRTARTNKRLNSISSAGPRGDSEPPPAGTSKRWGHGVTRSSEGNIPPIPILDRYTVVPEGGVSLKDEPISIASAPLAQAPSQELAQPSSQAPAQKVFVSRLRPQETHVISLTPKTGAPKGSEVDSPPGDQPTTPLRKRRSSSLPQSALVAEIGKGKTISAVTSNTTVVTAATTASQPALASLSSNPSSVATPTIQSKKSSGFFARLFFDEKVETPVQAVATAKSDKDSGPAIGKVVEKEPSAVPSATKHEPEPNPSVSFSEESSSNRKSLMGWFKGNSKQNTKPTSKEKSSLPATTQEVIKPAPKSKPASNRLPIHVERAIYRLSHIKLADPRRPLNHQVQISNLMFWYLSIIQQQPQPQNNANRPPPQTQSEPAKNPKKSGKDSASNKKGRRKQDSIQKRNPTNQHSTQRRGSETAYRAPQYEIQAQQYRNPPPQPPPHQQIYAPVAPPRHTQQDQNHHSPQQPGSGQIYQASNPQHANQRYPGGPESQNGSREGHESGDDSADDSETDRDLPPPTSRPDNGARSDDVMFDQMNKDPRFEIHGENLSGVSAEALSMVRDSTALDWGKDLTESPGARGRATGLQQGAVANFHGSPSRMSYDSGSRAMVGGGAGAGSGVMSEAANRRRSQSPGAQLEGKRSPSPGAERQQRARSGGMRGVGYQGMTTEDDEDNVPLGMYARVEG